MSRVALSGVEKDYGGFRAVRDFSLDVAQGELVALLGPSGCGKTTTLRMIAGFVVPTRGSIRIGERDVTALPPYRRATGMVFQGYALFPHMTAAENVGFGLEMRKVPKAEAEARVAEALRLVRLDGHGGRYPRQLSGGQQQRVALARALVIEPDVLLLDEPLSNLDAKLRHDVRLEIRQLQQQLGLTTVFVTHDQEEALSVADRLVVMNRGRIVQVGSPRTLYDTPRSAFVADFMGRSNFFHGAVIEPGLFRTASGLRLRFDGAVPAEPSVLAVRPERMRLIAPGDDAGPDNAVDGTARVVTFLGAQREIVVDVPEAAPILVQAPAGEDAAVDPGQPVRVAWPVAASLLIDASDDSDPAAGAGSDRQGEAP